MRKGSVNPVETTSTTWAQPADLSALCTRFGAFGFSAAYLYGRQATGYQLKAIAFPQPFFSKLPSLKTFVSTLSTKPITITNLYKGYI